MKRTALLGTVLAASWIGAGSASPNQAMTPHATHDDVAPARHDAPARRSPFPLLLVENRGQTDADVVAYARGRGTSVYFTSAGATYSLSGDCRRWTVKADLVGARTDVRPELRDAAPTTVSYFKGPKANWKTGLRTFRGIAYPDLWPGIDLVWTAGHDELKYAFVVRPGADPSRIQIAYRGATDVAVDADGTLIVTTPVADLRDAAPVTWQEVDGRRVPVESKYSLDDGVVGFHVGTYDARLPLVVDPTTIVYAGFLGGDGDDVGTGVAVDDVSSAYVSGHTNSSDPTFPRIAGPDLTQNGDLDAFIAKVAPGGASLVYVGFIGGDGIDRGAAVAVDSTHHAYVVGDTHSSRGSFPAPVDPVNLGNPSEDGFVVKLSPSGDSIDWSSFLGGADADLGAAVAVDRHDDVYVAGTTRSSQFSFPVRVGPSLVKSGAGDEDAFVMKLAGDGTGIVYAGFIGGTVQPDEGSGIAVDVDGAAYVAGWTSASDFPVTVGPGLFAPAKRDAYIAKVKPDGSGFDYVRLVGGAGDDRANAVAVDAQKRAYIVGTTTSDESTFPVKVGPYLTFSFNASPSIRQDAYVARVKADGSGLEYCGYIGGKQEDTGTGVAVNAIGQAFVTGSTFSSAGSFPVIGGPGLKDDVTGFEDAYVARVKAGGSGLVACGFISGLGLDHGNAIALGDAGAAYVVGATKSNGGSFPAVGGPDLTRNDAPAANLGDAFIAKVSSPLSQTALTSFILAKQATAKFNAKNPAKSKLTVTGSFNLGATAPNWSAASTLDVGGLHFDIPAFSAFKAATKYAYSAGGLTFSITPATGGSSNAALSLTYVGDLTGKVAVNGDLTLRLATDVVTATATVHLTGGVFRLAAPHGRFIEPCIFIGHATGKILGPGKDTLSLALGIATDGATPADKGDVTITFGSFSRTIPASQFTRKGSKDVFADKKGDVTSVVVDWTKQTVTVVGKNLTLGTFAQGANAVDVTVEVGDGDIHEVEVQVGVKGTSLTY